MAGIFQPNVLIFQPNVFQRNVFQEEQPFYGGVGHFLYEREQARKLAKITRKTPQPIDRRTQPTFAPIAGAPIAAAAPAPVVASMQNELMAGQMQAAAAKKKRDLEAILLLAS